MLFVIPANVVPWVVACGLIAARLPDLLRGSVSLERIAVLPGNAFFSFGPALVFLIAREPSANWRGGAIVAAASRRSSPSTSSARACSNGSRSASIPAELLRPLAWTSRSTRWSHRSPTASLSPTTPRGRRCCWRSRCSCSSRSSPASGESDSTRCSSSRAPTGAPRSCWATSSRPTTRTREPQPAGRRPRRRGLRQARARRRASVGRRVHRAAPRRRQDPHPERRSSTSPARSTTAEREIMQHAHDRGRADARRGSAGCSAMSAVSFAPATSTRTAPATPTVSSATRSR